jgi:hypothetical protein
MFLKYLQYENVKIKKNLSFQVSGNNSILKAKCFVVLLEIMFSNHYFIITLLKIANSN